LRVQILSDEEYEMQSKELSAKDRIFLLILIGSKDLGIDLSDAKNG